MQQVVSSSLQEIVCCMGQPVAGNPTQYIMEKAIAAAKLDLRVLTVEVAPQELGDALRGVRAMGFRGAILADPLTSMAGEYLDELTPVAEMTGEVNFIQRRGDRLAGDNTTGKGLLQSLNSSVVPRGKRVMILGAGRAATAIAADLAGVGASEVLVVNRTVDRGQKLVDLLTERTGVAATLVHWVGSVRVPEETAVVVQAASMADTDHLAELGLDLSSLDSNAAVVDLRLDPPTTRLLRDAGQLGLITRDGLDLLLGKATIAFQRWTGIQPDRGLMREALEEFLML